jgi:hypothetical protein
MKRINFKDLQPGKVYYVHTSYRKEKGTFVDWYESLCDGLEFVIFEKVEHIQWWGVVYNDRKVDYLADSTIFYLPEKDIIEKVISKAKLQQPTDDVCSVCFENHIMCDVLQTSCGHQIGKECYQMWVNQCNSKNNPITCTVCRRVRPKVWGFRQRKTKKNAQVLA